ncbi:Major facilitator superfamily transporter [Tolypocladium paradoxum]|uniref:Major facilitator superfamily transporter n=1 Tax=Tolypocladium paradoxum TaxID=94208 RepID=A0A2S4KP51_9HYPO|nr:Major facilitator superfamily transporter [Tolypocladium paradoxum]
MPLFRSGVGRPNCKCPVQEKLTTLPPVTRVYPVLCSGGLCNPGGLRAKWTCAKYVSDSAVTAGSMQHSPPTPYSGRRCEPPTLHVVNVGCWAGDWTCLGRVPLGAEQRVRRFSYSPGPKAAPYPDRDSGALTPTDAQSIMDQHRSNDDKSQALDVEKAVLDIEKVAPADLAHLAGPETKQAEDAADPLLVTFQGHDDPAHPFNWSQPKKWAITLLLSMGGLVTLMSGAMLAPALGAIAHDFQTDEEQTQIFLSIFVLAFAFGPMVLAPVTEIFGRRPVWILWSCFYILWNTVAGFSRSPGLMIASRVLSGLGASAEFAVSNPVLADCWEPAQRGVSFAISSFVPLLGPAIGPIVGGAVTQAIGWRWIFWITSIFDAILVIIAIFVFSETYQVIILTKKAAELRKATGKPYHAEGDGGKLSTKLSQSLSRPLRLLLTQPIIQLVGVFLAYNFGILYIALSTFATLWTERYGQGEAASGLHYIAIVIGYTIAAQVGARVMDWLWAYLQARAGGNETAPEYRVPLMVPGAVLIPVGLFVYGWTAQERLHWIAPDIGIAIFGCGIILNTQALQAYVMEAYRKYVASASAASQFLRSIAGFAFPIFAPAMYQHLGYGWGNSLLAFTSIALGLPAPALLWFYGAKLRAMGKPQW